MGRAMRWFMGLFGIKKEDSGDRKECKDRSFSHSGRGSTGLIRNPGTIPPNITSAEATWLRTSFFNQSENEQSRHAIAVAAATAAAADAAVAAAQAAAEVVRLTNQGRGNGSREKWAAIKIQTFFRGYLSRKALRALRGLVKLQAVVRGVLVRRQANATLHSMQALIRVQATVRAQKTCGFINNDNDKSSSSFRAQKCIERFDETSSEQSASNHSRGVSASFDSNNNNNAIDESSKIVEVDTGRPKSRNRRANTWVLSDSSSDPYGQSLSSPHPFQVPARITIPDSWNSKWGPTRDECRFSTAQSTPRLAHSVGSNNAAPVTPAKSVCLDGYFRPGTNSPNYMANTQSFKAKLRSHSAPKQRPEAGPRKKLSLNEMMESRSSLSGVKMQKSCSQAQEVVSFKNAVMGKFGRASSFVMAPQERNCYI